MSRLILLAASVTIAVATADGRALSPARQAVCAPSYCSRQAQTCQQACITTTTDAANRDHTLALCQDFCREEDAQCRDNLCRAPRGRRR
ncbi:MAG TPA: hypothetical protein VG271_02975 [Beijerinckiaceae bacterium]|nr:hypothetical protein [Beijerinckiaceae bacterium]